MGASLLATMMHEASRASTLPQEPKRRVQARFHSAQGWPTATSESRPERAFRSADAGAQFEWAAGLGLDLVQTHARVKLGQGQATAFEALERDAARIMRTRTSW